MVSSRKGHKSNSSRINAQEDQPTRILAEGVCVCGSSWCSSPLYQVVWNEQARPCTGKNPLNRSHSMIVWASVVASRSQRSIGNQQFVQVIFSWIRLCWSLEDWRILQSHKLGPGVLEQVYQSVMDPNPPQYQHYGSHSSCKCRPLSQTLLGVTLQRPVDMRFMNSCMALVIGLDKPTTKIQG